MSKLLLGAIAALALVAAAPALACDDCKNCPMHKKEAAASTQKAPAVAEEKKDEHACACKDAKSCKCSGEKCACAGCKVEKKDEAKKS